MIETSARVISSANGTVLVEPAIESGCGGCKSRSSCGVSGLGKYFSTNRKAIAVRCDANVSAGDELQLSMSEGDLIKAGLLAYLLPCVFSLIGAGVSSSLGLGDASAALSAGVGMAAGFVSGRLTGWVPRIDVNKTRAAFQTDPHR